MASCAALSTIPARAEVSEVRISRGYGVLYLPLMVMEQRKLLEKKAAEAGLGDVKSKWFLFDGGNIINDAMLAGSLDIAGTGAPGFVTLWSKSKGASAEVIGVSGMSGTGLSLNTTNPAVKSLADFTAADKIAMPGIKTSLAAVVLQMAAAKQLGKDKWNALDPFTVGLPHPEAYTALVSGKTGIDAHFASPPYSTMELRDPKVHSVYNSVQGLGPITLDVVFAPKKFVEANPKVMAAFLAAFDEACDIIAKDKKGATDDFVASLKTKLPYDEALGIVSDKDTTFSATPKGVGEFANFLADVGSIKNRPSKWSDMFMPALANRPGS
ncbi:MAG: ABC transporter substrate-binding protein [Hyphomicrobiales bacterium]|nr:ABC transporter substrate-binding protein [Hyphomicrobiales bacterium]